MSKAVATTGPKSLEKILIQGDLSQLSEPQRMEYVNAICKAMGISLLFRPFDFITFKGKTVLYANKSLTEQLRKKHKISIRIVARERVDNLYVVTAQALMKGKEDESIGAINIGGLRGEDLANAIMKAETKAKRRATLSICGLGILDELQAKDMAEAESEREAVAHTENVEAKINPETKRPEFESIQTPAAEPVKEEAKSIEEPTGGNYRMKVGKNNGKLVKDLPVKKLQDWVKWYAKMKEGGKDLHPDVETEVIHITQYLDELKLNEEESKKEKKS